MTYSAERAVGEIKAQHAMLRDMMDRCEAFADEVDAKRCGPLQLTREVARLRLAFVEHNKFEEELLRRHLLAGVGAEVMDHRLDEHEHSHRAMRVGLQSDETSMLREVIEAMRAHLVDEERYLFTVTTVRAPALAE